MNQLSIAKLMPPRTGRAIRRPRVNQSIRDSLEAGTCWIAAPAGYGKTTAVADWLSATAAAHLWYRVDEGDQDIASFFHYLALSLGDDAARHLPVFGPEYSEQPLAFARRFFRNWFALLDQGTVVIFDDLHNADVDRFRSILVQLLTELPTTIHCICISRTLPPEELNELRLKGQISVLSQDALEFSDPEAQALVRVRMGRRAAAIDAAPARGWAIGLVMLTDRSASMQFDTGPNVQFNMLGDALFAALAPAERTMLLQLNLLPEISVELAAAAAGEGARALIDRLQKRQLLVARGGAEPPMFSLHDLLREFLDRHFEREFSMDERAAARLRVAEALDRSGRRDDAIDLALKAEAWPFATLLIGARAEVVLGQGRRATFIDWCSRLPDDVLDARLCYWLGVAHMPDDLAAESWLSRAWGGFDAAGDRGGMCLAAARAIIVKTDSWRTHERLSLWTARVMTLLGQPLPSLQGNDELLMLAGFVRALDFTDDHCKDATFAKQLAGLLRGRLAMRRESDSASLRLLASEVLIEHAGSTGQAQLFAQAVDSVIGDLEDAVVSPWALGLWLVAFGAVSGRYFSYVRRGFRYVDPDVALREAMAIGERESLRGVEFGALYHLQLRMKASHRFDEFGQLVGRLAQIADSRYTTQVAVLADCEAAMHTLRGNFVEARAACVRVMHAIEAANEPMVERWPHFVTQFQVLLGSGDAAGAASYLEGVVALFDDALRERTEVCIAAAETVMRRQSGEPDYHASLAAFIQRLRAANWPAVLLNLPRILAALCADALDHGIEEEFCCALIARRCLAPPASAPARWPWALKIYVLGPFRLERDGVALDLGPKPPTRSLDILRLLAISRDHACHIDALADQFWPDADGDRAKAACEQALHRLRKLLGRVDLVIQREGRLHLAPDLVWVDLADWQARLDALDANDAENLAALQRAFASFRGPLLVHQRKEAWWARSADRVRGRFLDLALTLGGSYEAAGGGDAARQVWRAAIAHYPDSSRLARLIEHRADV